MQVGVTGKKQLFLGANAAVTRCLRRVFLRSSSIKLGFSDVSDSISLSQAVHTALRVHPRCFSKCNLKQQQTKKSLLAQTSPALQSLPLAFCQLPIVSGLSIWPRRRRGQTYCRLNRTMDAGFRARTKGPGFLTCRRHKAPATTS